MNHDIGTYYIIYPEGNRTKLTVIFLPYEIDYEIFDYARASRKEFDNLEEAIEYAKTLAQNNGLEYVFPKTNEDYLD
jgi:hypothetical protein